MKLYFVLPKVSRYPVGGYKMVYEYANRLLNKGYEIYIIFINVNLLYKYHFPESIRTRLSKLLTKIEPRWFPLDKRIKKISVDNINEELKIDSQDYLIATAVETYTYIKNKNAKKAYFIQGFENWNINESELYESYSNDIKKIVISSWLKEVVDKHSFKESTLVRNPIDYNTYKIKIPFNDRVPHSIALLYNEHPVKGFIFARDVIYELKKKYPNLIVNMFGRKTYEGKLPSWIKYTVNASQSQTIDIYNKSRVFLCSSIEDGFGLTGLEAMSCGCVLISTEFLGVKEYAINGYNALLSPVKNVKGLVDNVVKVFEDTMLSEVLSYNARKTATEFSWEKAVDDFERVIIT